MKILAENLRKFRKERGRTQEWVAKKMCIDRTTYTKYETDSADPSIAMVSALCNALDITPNQLFGWNEPEEK